MTDSRYPYTYACDFIRSLGPVDSSGVVLSRSDASQVRSGIARALGINDKELAEKLADAQLANGDDRAVIEQQQVQRLMNALGYFTPLSPAAQAVLDAFNREAGPEPHHQLEAIAAALRAAADHIRTIGPWVGHIDSPGLDWAVTELSSAAQAVLDAAEGVCRYRPDPEDTRLDVAAALRAAALQLREAYANETYIEPADD